MDAKRVLLICDTDRNELNRIQQAFEEKGYEVETINDAGQLIGRVEKRQHSVIIVNPDLPGFREDDICRKVMKEMRKPLLFLIDKNSTTRAQISDCDPDDVVTKPVELNNLINLVDKHVAVTASNSR
jgi:DNA-binding response OmpR family regulator